VTGNSVRKEPCSTCPYRLDVPSGVWASHEYEKLRPYDLPTGDQPVGTFGCHATPEHYCHGWAVVHSSRGGQHELLALRIWRPKGGIPPAAVPLFASGNEAADWGQADIEDPSPEALAAVRRLLRKYDRLEGDREAWLDDEEAS